MFMFVLWDCGYSLFVLIQVEAFIVGGLQSDCSLIDLMLGIVGWGIVR